VPPVVAPLVDAARYTLYANTPVTGELRPTGLGWEAFGSATGPTASSFDSTAGVPSPDGGVHREITPNPADYGWGLFLYAPSGTTENLSAFADGHLNFSVRSDSYPGQIEIGISTDTDDRDGQEAFVQIGPGDYGYCNTNEWCQVSIPVSAFLAVNPKLDLRLVSFRFTIADRFSFTGKPLNLTGLPKLHIDDIHWSR
jgi:hypothetical protein